MSTSRWRWFSLVLVVALAVMLIPGLLSAQTPSSRQQAEPIKNASPSQQQTPLLQEKGTQETAIAKIHPDLRDLAQSASPQVATNMDIQVSGPTEAVLVEVIAAVEAADKLDLDPYFVDGQVFARPPFGKGEQQMQVFFGRVDPSNLLKIASITQVQRILPVVLEQNAEPFPYPPDEERTIPEKGREDWAALREQADELRAGSLSWNQAKAFGDGRPDVRPQDWFEVKPEGPHKAETAWSRGYRGEGVTVAVLDDGIDTAHPDLMGTQKIYSSSVASEYNGWPMVFSPYSMLLYALDNVFGTTYVEDASPGIHYVDTSVTKTVSSCGPSSPGQSCFQFTPLIDYQTPNPSVPAGGYRYRISDTMTAGGVVHLGTHPDNDLRDFIWGEKPAVLVTDPNTAGVFDTVYVDMDADHDFRDEKPLTRADVNDPNTYNDMIAYRDFTNDGLPDISGGMLYFIADGSTVIPGSDWVWGADCGAGFMCPGNGNLVAFSGGTFDRPYSHGTQCASNIAGQGRTSGVLPEFVDAGVPSGAVFGMAPEADLVNVSDIYYNFDSSRIDAYIFAAVGYDGIDQTGYNVISGTVGNTDTDAIQITTNSYGESNVDNDGWDYFGQLVSHVQRWYGPNLQFLFSTGNGASAYGTVAPSSPATGIGVGASTEFGSTGWDSITSSTQIMNNDVTPFSNRGPGARGTAGTDVVAGGAFAAGSEELNYATSLYAGIDDDPATSGIADPCDPLDGNCAWASWGGTSRSAPVAGGVLALLYQAYYDNNGTWPTYEEAQALLMSSATDVDYDTFTQGAGSVNADRGTAVAGGLYGVYVTGEGPTEPAPGAFGLEYEGLAPTWQPGDYRGNDYPGFAHIAYPGDSFTKTFTVHNPGADPVNVSINDSEMNLVDSVEFDFQVTEAMVSAESAYGASNRDNFYHAFNYFIPITGSPSADSSWHNIDVPANTDLMIVRQTFPYDQFDSNGDYSFDNRFYLAVYNWKDNDSDGIVWDDKDSNGVVNFINSGVVNQIDGAEDLDWNDSRTELDRWEFGRFSYHRPGGNRNEMWVQDPLGRMQDGLFIGLRHDPSSTYTGPTDLHYRIDFYEKTDSGWLSTSDSNITVAPGNSESFVATADVPSDIPVGMYEASIEIHDPGMAPTYTADTSVIPVALTVAAPFTDGLQLGGMDSYNYDADRPYNNGAVRGLFDWTWREESGDWRFFMTDVDGSQYPTGTQFLVRDVWNDAAPHTDIDTIALGPSPTSLGSDWYSFAEPAFYGPYTLDTVAKSPNTNAGGGTWIYDTSSGTNEDWIAGPLQDGLHAFLQHNVLFEGDKIDAVFTKTVGTLQSTPQIFNIAVVTDTGTVGTMQVQSSIELNGLVADGFGLGAPEVFADEPINFVDSNTIEWTDGFNVTHGAKIDLSTSSSNISDIDLYLFYCGPTGAGPCEQRAASTTGSANEHVQVLMPEDGVWIVGINNWSGPAGNFTLVRNVIQGFDLSVSGTPTGTIPANTPVNFTINYSRTMQAGETYEGLLLFGPPEAPALQQVPIYITKSPFQKWMPLMFKQSP